MSDEAWPGGGTLPVARTPLIGRDAERATMTALLGQAEPALLTLTGPGGVGKTRLALEVARDVQPAYPDGVWFVPLAAIRDADLLAEQIAAALQLPTTGPSAALAHLARFLHDKRLLLVLDNFEQILDASPAVGALLAGAPGLRVLATSRRPLRLAGEQEFPVPPLAVPAPVAGSTPDSLTEAPAARLFLARARAIRPDFAVTAETAPLVAAICVRLDGLPLALELAAAQVRVFALPTLLARLEGGLAGLTDGRRDRPLRQQTMRATAGWSYDLLTPPAQALFARLAVFAGGWTLEALPAVCGDDGPDAGSPSATEPALLGALAELVEASLVQLRDTANVARYNMLETIRAYAEERLGVSGEETTRRERHARYFLTLMQTAGPELDAAGQRAWLTRLDQEQANLRAALGWALAHAEVEAAARAASAVWRLWSFRGSLREGRRWLDETLRQGADLPAALRADVLNAAGNLAGSQIDLPASAAYLEESLALSRTQGDRVGIVRALNNLGLAIFRNGDYPGARTHFLESLALARQAGDSKRMSHPLSNLGLVTWALGDYRQARDYLEEALRLQRSYGHEHGVALNLMNLGVVLARTGEGAAADAAFAESLTLYQALGSQWGLTLWLLRRAAALHAGGAWAPAAQVWGAAQTQLDRIGAPMEAVDLATYTAARAQARAHGEGTAWDAAETAGRRQPLAAALALAATPAGPTPGRAGPDPLPDGLTRREVEVLRLLATGRSNAEIAERLVLSRRTVQAHLYAIYQKLDVRTRHAAGQYARQHGLT